MADVQAYLKHHGVRPSLQRMAVMEYLMTHRTHPTADEIYGALSPSMPTLSKTTVYNTLNLLAERSAVLVLDIDARQTRFDGDTSLHAHFLCKSCGAIHDMPVPAETVRTIRLSEAAQVDDVQILYKGICCECYKNKQ